jgi:hypothetical protein
MPDDEHAGDIDDADNAKRWTNPETGEIEYDWPSEEARHRAARRAKLRADRLQRIRSGEDVSDDDDDVIDVDE